MSTILDALRKAQEETGDKRPAPVGEHPASSEAVTPALRPRRRLGWPVAMVGVLGLAVAGGLAFGDRIAGLLGRGADSSVAPQDQQVASRSEDAGSAAPADAGVKQKQGGEPVTGSAPVRRGKSPDRADAVLRKVDPAAAPAVEAPGQAAAPEVAPSPYGRLHVFGAGERPAGEKASADERLARLQQLREKMLKARKDAAARGSEEDAAAAPTQIFVPPPRQDGEGAPPAGRPAAPVAPSSERAAAPHEAPPGGVAPAGVTHELVVDTAPADGAPTAREAGAAPTDAQPPAPAVDAADVQPPEPAVGVSVANAHAEGADAEIRDPDIPPVAVAAAGARAAKPPAPEPRAEKPAAPEPAVAVAALTPPEPAQAQPIAVAPKPVSAPVQPVLRRAPGGAPQVAINILQWSAEPARRFAFVSVDGGNMTQVREGDRIGGLTVKHIHQQMIEFGFNDATFLLRAN